MPKPAHVNLLFCVCERSVKTNVELLFWSLFMVNSHGHSPEFSKIAQKLSVYSNYKVIVTTTDHSVIRARAPKNYKRRIYTKIPQ